MLEPYVGKLTRTVLRREEGSNPLDLSDYVFVSKQLFLRMTIIDIKTKLIIAEKLVNEEEYNDQTIKDFLENNINTETLKSITTDGRKNYKTIISAIGAIHHRCFFHLMQNLIHHYKNTSTN